VSGSGWATGAAEISPLPSRAAGGPAGPRAARTVSAILDATREIFLTRGYAGTTIDDITRTAGVSRPSFYTYFASKRSALIALGADSLTQALEVVGVLSQVRDEARDEGFEMWVSLYFNYLELHGSLAFAWTQAAHEDAEIRVAGQRGHLELCRRLGTELAVLRGCPPRHPVEDGLLIVSMLERAWAYTRLYGAAVDGPALRSAAVQMLTAVTSP
jgi:AcrR family transcriptional regulator